MSDRQEFIVRVANHANAGANPSATRCWWVAGVAEDGVQCAGYLPKDTIEEVTDPQGLIGLRVHGYPAEHQKNPTRRWFTFVAPVRQEDGEDEVTIGAIETLHQWSGQTNYRITMQNAVSNIAQSLSNISSQLDKATQALKGLNNL